MSELKTEYLRSGRGLSKAIKAGRKERKMSQQELANTAGLSREWISAIENDPDKAQNVSMILAVRLLLAVGYRLAVEPIRAPRQIEEIDAEQARAAAKGLDVLDDASVSTLRQAPKQ